MNEFHTDIWKTILPEGWDGDEDDDGVVLYANEGVGELQISVSEMEEGLVDEEDLEYFAAELIEDEIPFSRVRIGEFQGLFFEYDDGEDYCREWYLAYDELFFYVTYNCDPADRHVEEHHILEILKAINFH